jgi:hypothetical protein
LYTFPAARTGPNYLRIAGESRGLRLRSENESISGIVIDAFEPCCVCCAHVK